MSRKILVFAVVALLAALAGSALAVELVKVKPIPENLKYIYGDESIPNVPYYPSSPGLICSPGDTMGFTQYDYQENGSSGRSIVIDSQGGIHVAWMCGDPYPSVRNIKFNCLTTSGSPWPGIGQTVSYANLSGYTQIGITNDDRAAVAYHRATPSGSESTFVALDAFTCLGTFEYHRPLLRQGASHMVWPYLTVDRNNRIHVIATTTTTGAQPFGYIRSNDGGTTWVAYHTVDTLRTISPVVVSSKVSDKVAIVYTHPADTTQTKNNVYYIQSADGITWDWTSAGKVNITNYGRNRDSLWAYTEVSALYDYNDNLHIVWNGQYRSTAGGYYYGRSHMYHWDATSNSIHYFADFDSVWPSAGCDMPVWNFTFAKFSVATDLANNLYVAYSSWDTSDCSLAGFANGDIYLQYSTDNGVTWQPRINLTNSQSPQCPAGDCESDMWSSLAEKADTSLHLFYVNDRDAGGIPQTEGSATDNPVLYLHYRDNLPLTSIKDDINVPKAFTLDQNYPNPFNARTNISFELTKPGLVNLTVYDITGAKVATLVSDNLSAGAHQVNWDASGIASGVYYYTLKTNGSEVTKKMTLLK